MNEDLQLPRITYEEETPTVSGNSPDPPASDETPGGTLPDDAETLPGGEDAPGSGEAGEGSLPPDEEVEGGGDSPSEEAPPAEEDGTQAFLDALDEISGRLEDAPDYEDLASSVRSLVDVMSLQLTEDAAIAAPFEGYRDWNYGVTVSFEVYPYGYGNYLDQTVYCSAAEDFETWYQDTTACVGETIRDFYIKTITDDEGVEIYNYEKQTQEPSPSIPLTGYEAYAYPVDVLYRIFVTAQNTEVEQAFTYDSPEHFEDGYALICNAVDSGDFGYFSIRTVTDADGETVYHADAATDPGEGEEDSFQEDVLSSLALLHEDLQSISMNDLGYREETLALQQEYTDLMKESRELHYQTLACTVAIGFSVLLTLGYLVAHGFFQRMKVG